MLTATFSKKTILASGYMYSGKTASGLAVNNIYDSKGVLLEQDVILSTTQLAKYFVNSDKSYTLKLYSNNVLTSSSDYTAKDLMLSQSTYTSGILKQTSKFGYNAYNQIIIETKLNATNNIIETLYNTYINNKFDTITHVNNKNVITEIDYYSNGKVVNVTKPLTSFDSVTFQTSNITSSTWNTNSGLGESNLLKALSLTLNKQVADVTPTQKLQASLTNIHFDDSWAIGFTGKDIVIANIDTGLDLKNTNLTQNLSKFNWNFINNTSNVQDDNGHGSFTASQMIAKPNNNGIVGGAYDAQLMVLKALDSSGNGTEANIAKAIVYAVDNGADIINLSLGSTSQQNLVFSALTYAQQHGVLVTAAAGNSGSNSLVFPASYAKSLDNVIAVGATTQNETMASFSNKAGSGSPFEFLDAPGVNVQGYNHKGLVVTQSGTSMSSAFVAAELADLMQAERSINPTLTDSQIAFSAEDSLLHGIDLIGVVTNATATYLV
jgi:hypothetical protein